MVFVLEVGFDFVFAVVDSRSGSGFAFVDFLAITGSDSVFFRLLELGVVEIRSDTLVSAIDFTAMREEDDDVEDANELSGASGIEFIGGCSFFAISAGLSLRLELAEAERGLRHFEGLSASSST